MFNSCQNRVSTGAPKCYKQRDEQVSNSERKMKPATTTSHRLPSEVNMQCKGRGVLESKFLEEFAKPTTADFRFENRLTIGTDRNRTALKGHYGKHSIKSEFRKALESHDYPLPRGIAFDNRTTRSCYDSRSRRTGTLA
jgi:hypothetical protein